MLPSGKSICRAGERLADSEHAASQEDTTILNIWREYHIPELIATIKDIDEMLGSSDNIIVTGRIKRMDSIIKKLRRTNKQYHLHQLDDIAGIRIITNSYEQSLEVIDKIYRRYRSQVIKRKDYRCNPNNGGYRALHLVLKIPKEPRDIRIEIQVRTRREHAWASLVEILDTIQNTSIKTQPEGIYGEDSHQNIPAMRRLLSDLSTIFYDIEHKEHINRSMIVQTVRSDYFKKIAKILNAIRCSTFPINKIPKSVTRVHLLILHVDRQEIEVMNIDGDYADELFLKYNNYQPDSNPDSMTDAVLMLSNNSKNVAIAFPQIMLEPVHVLEYFDEMNYISSSDCASEQ